MCWIYDYAPVKCILLIAFCYSFTAQATFAEEPDFRTQVRPILSEFCFSCHGPDEQHREADFRLDAPDDYSLELISPNAPESSSFLERIESADHDLVMPPAELKKELSPKQKQILKNWVESGAQTAPHWAFEKIPQHIPLPAAEIPPRWNKPIDQFVWAKIQEHQLVPSLPASKERWLRRVTFDLTGLPPTLKELDDFLADNSPEARSSVVDRLLKETSFGERLAADWLDTARYADTFGYQNDQPMHVWPWREWVIQAFNKNMPWDQFLTWQLAGDLIDSPTTQSRLATAFNRLHRQTNEGGSVEEEFRIEYVSDRVKTFGTAFLGLTFECARCHDHKYDPFSQTEYYQLSALFNNIDEHGLYSHFTQAVPTPTLRLYKGDQQQQHQHLLSQIANREQQLATRLKEQITTSFKADAPVLKTITLPETAYENSFAQEKSSGSFKVVEGRSNAAIELNGDDAYSCKEAPELSRTQPMTVELTLKPTMHKPRMIVAHQSRAAEDSAFRGFSIVLDQGIPTISLVHFWPGNALQIRARKPVPLNQWTNLTVTYDGRSKAEGLKLYLNGVLAEVDVRKDKLTRDITHKKEWGDSNAGSLRLSLGARFRDIGFKQGQIDDVAIWLQELTAVEIAHRNQTLPQLTDKQKATHLALREDAKIPSLQAELLELRQRENQLITQVQEIMTMQEMPYSRVTHRLDRGVYDAPAEQVSAHIPQQLGLLPKKTTQPPNRLALAEWLTSPDHPLTARVVVNRFWKLFFGRGLVATAQDFGSQGSPPSHPELLDWLARDFMEHQWDIKRLCKMIVLSETYSQDSLPQSSTSFEEDRQNIWLSRGPRHRLSAEQLRDQALAASGLLKRKIGGPSVYPYQPAGLWKESGTGKTYRQSTGDDLYRRSLYTFWRRTSPPPTMLTFDAPSREFCIAQRERTASPLQALTLLNDPQFTEAARILAAKLLRSNDDPQLQLSDGFRLLTSRKPTGQEQEILLTLYHQQVKYWADNPEQAKLLLEVGDSPVDEKLPRPQHAALTSVVQTLMSYDESTTKR